MKDMEKKPNSGLKDSGKRESFKTGSVRDVPDGKGNPHLIAGEAMLEVMAVPVKKYTNDYDAGVSLVESYKEMLRFSINTDDKEGSNCYVVQAASDLLSTVASPTVLYRRLAVHYENGSKKYSKNNWRLGQPVSRYFDSCIRHLWSAMDDEQDEDHKAAALWNMIAILQTKIDVKRGNLPKELDDFPFLNNEIWSKQK